MYSHTNKETRLLSQVRDEHGEIISEHMVPLTLNETLFLATQLYSFD